MPAIEMVTFKTTDNTPEQEFLAASEELQQWATDQAGFQKRWLVRKDNGDWTDIVLWQDKQSALDAAEKFMGSPLTSKFMSFVVPESVVMEHTEVISPAAVLNKILA